MEAFSHTFNSELCLKHPRYTGNRFDACCRVVITVFMSNDRWVSEWAHPSHNLSYTNSDVANQIQNSILETVWLMVLETDYMLT